MDVSDGLQRVSVTGSMRQALGVALGVLMNSDPSPSVSLAEISILRDAYGVGGCGRVDSHQVRVGGSTWSRVKSDLAVRAPRIRFRCAWSRVNQTSLVPDGCLGWFAASGCERVAWGSQSGWTWALSRLLAHSSVTPDLADERVSGESHAGGANHMISHRFGRGGRWET